MHGPLRGFFWISTKWMQQAKALELVVWYLDRVRKEKESELKNAERKEKEAEEKSKGAFPEGWTSWRGARNEVREQWKELKNSEIDLGLLYLSTCCRLIGRGRSRAGGRLLCPHRMGDEQKDDEQMDEQEENFYDDEEELKVYTQKDYDDAEEIMTRNESHGRLRAGELELARQWERQHPEVNPGSSSSSIGTEASYELVEQMQSRSASERRATAERSEMKEERKQGVETMTDPTGSGIDLFNSPGGEDATRRNAEQLGQVLAEQQCGTARPGRQEGKYMDRSKGPAIAMGRSKGKYLDRSERKAKTPTLVPAAANDEVREVAEAAAVKAYIRAVSKYHKRLCQCGNEAATGCDKCGRCCSGCERHGRKAKGGKVESSKSSGSSESDEEEEGKPWRGASEEAKEWWRPKNSKGEVSEWWSARGFHPRAEQKGDGGSSSTDAAPPPPTADAEEDHAMDQHEDVIKDEDDLNDRMRILVMMLEQKKKSKKKKKQERHDTDTEAQDLRTLREARDLLELRDLRKKTANWEPWKIQKEKNDRAQALRTQKAAVEAAGDIRGSQMEADGAPEEDEGARRGTRGGRRSHEADGAPYVPDVSEDEGARRDI